MARVLTPEDFSDHDLTDLFDRISHLEWGARLPLPPRLARTVARFCEAPPRAQPREFRAYLPSAADGMHNGDGSDRRAVLTAALRAYYLTAWLDRLPPRDRDPDSDTALTCGILFTPVFKASHHGHHPGTAR